MGEDEPRVSFCGVPASFGHGCAVVTAMPLYFSLYLQRARQMLHPTNPTLGKTSQLRS